MKYEVKIIKNESIEKMIEEVNENTKYGFFLHGDMFMIDSCYCQLVKGYDKLKDMREKLALCVADGVVCMYMVRHLFNNDSKKYTIFIKNAEKWGMIKVKGLHKYTIIDEKLKEMAGIK